MAKFVRLGAFLALVATANAAITRHVKCASGHVTANAACCSLFPIVDNILQAQLFDGGECGEEAHSALRLSFHDAIGFSIHGGKGGGADGSILAFNRTETAFHANQGIDDITDEQFPLFQQSGLSAGDFLHLAAAVGTANCPGAPRLKFFLGRPPPKAAAPDLTVPEPTDDVTAILARFADAGFTPQEAIALLSSHTVAAADVVDPGHTGIPFDSTPFTFDTQVFLEVLLTGSMFPGDGIAQPGEVASPINGEMRLQSDFVLSRDPRTACLWQEMVNNQELMTSRFQSAMAKLQVLGHDTRRLIDCSDVVPVPKVLADPIIKLPPTFTMGDVQSNCANLRLPALATQAGPAITVAPVPGS